MFGEGAGAKSGSPFVEGVCVAGEVVEQTRGDKILVFKKTRRQNYRRTNGHRQDLPVVRITAILTDGKKPEARKSAGPKKAAQPKGETTAKTDPAETAAQKKTAAKEAPAKKQTPQTTAKKKNR